MRRLMVLFSAIAGNLRQGFQSLSAAARRVREADLPLLVGSLSYSTVLSLVPLLAVSLSVFHFFGGLDFLLKQIEPFLLRNLVESSGAELTKYLARAIRRVHSGAIGLGGVVVLLYASTKLFHDMEAAIQRVWLVTSKRALWKRLVVYWTVMFLGPLIVAGVLGALGSRGLDVLTQIPSGTVAGAIAFIALFAIYKWVPARRVEFGPSFAAALLAAAALALAQEFYAGVMRGLFRFSKLYGSLAGGPLLLIWILIVWWIVLLGATLAAVLQEKRDWKRDSIETRFDM